MEVIIQGEAKKKKRHEGAMMELLGGHSIFFFPVSLSFFSGGFSRGKVASNLDVLSSLQNFPCNYFYCTRDNAPSYNF